MISVNLQPDATGYVFIPGSGQEINASSVARARERAVEILLGHAASTGKAFEASIRDVGETLVVAVHPDGRIIVNRTVAQGRYRTEDGYEPVPAVPTMPEAVREVTLPPLALTPDEAVTTTGALRRTTAEAVSTPRTRPPVVEDPQLEDDELERTLIVRRSLRRRPHVQLQFSSGSPVVIHDSALIGRQPAAHPDHPGAQLVPVHDITRSVSKTHCAVTWSDETLAVTDLGSTNGTDIERGEETIALVAGVPGEIREGDKILIGDDWFTAVIVDETATASE